MDNLLGHELQYWIELEKVAREKGTVELIEEVAKLRGMVSFYESRIKMLNDFMQAHGCAYSGDVSH